MAREWKSTCRTCGAEFAYSDFTFRSASMRGIPQDATCASCSVEHLRAKKLLACSGIELDLSSEKAGRLLPLRLPTAGLGELPFPATWHSPVVHGSSLNEAAYGITSERLLEMYQLLQQPEVQVLIVEAPTGSGKSTYLPYRLLAPPTTVDPEIFTRHGQIVITQPRQKPTRDIPKHVARDLYGSSCGAGFDIGYRHRGANCSDWRTRMAYVTDGTLINWIVGGQLHNISLIVIDEAHERNVNIDVIMGMLAKVLPRYPRLKLLIASATINVRQFKEHFNSYLMGGKRCEAITFAGKQFGVKEYYRSEEIALPYIKSKLRDLSQDLPREMAKTVVHLLKRMYVPGFTQAGAEGGDLTEKRGDIIGFLQGERPIAICLREMEQEIAKIPELKNMVELYPLYRELPQPEQDRITDFRSKFNQRLVEALMEQLGKASEGPGGAGPLLAGITHNAGQLGHLRLDGDRSVFTPGDLVIRLRDQLAHQLQSHHQNVDIFVWMKGEEELPRGWKCQPDGTTLPLGALPSPEVGRLQVLLTTEAALDASHTALKLTRVRVTPDKTRVIIATNIAETSLTIHGILHVVDSGVINLSVWDLQAEKAVVGVQLHSQAGCRQRWGRAGRLQPGNAWCLYTQKQFQDVFAPYSVGEIQRAGLESVILQTKIAGIDQAQYPQFAWIEEPPPAEFQRAMLRLRQKQAIDADGDVTLVGAELNRNQGDSKAGQLLINADRFACAYELASLLIFFEDSRADLRRLFLGAGRSTPLQLARVGRVHNALRASCQDDLDLIFKVFASWWEAPERSELVCQNGAWSAIWKSAVNERLGKLLPALKGPRRKLLQSLLLAITERRQFGEVFRAAEWADVRNDFLRSIRKFEEVFEDACREAWAAEHFIHHEFLRDTLVPKWAEYLESLSEGKKDNNERRALNFEAIQRLRYILAWSMPENCFVQLPADGVTAVRRFVPLNDLQGTKANYHVELSRQSVCNHGSLDAFICAQRTTTERRAHAKATPESVTRTDIVIRLARSLLTQITGDSIEPGAGMTFWRLTQLLAKHGRLRGSGNSLVEPTRQRLMIDQYFPLGCQVKCRLVSWHTQSSTAQVTIQGVMALSADFEKIEVMTPTPPEDDSSTVLNDGDPPLPVSSEDVQALVEIAEELAPIRDAEEAETDEVRREVVSVLESDAATLSLPSICRFEQQTLYRDCRGVVHYRGSEPPEEFVAEVSGYQTQGEEPPRLLLRYPTQAMAYESFVKKFREGDRIQVRVLELCEFPLADAVNLRVVEVTTNLEILLDARELSHSRFGHVVRAVPLNSLFEVTVHRILQASRTVRVNNYQELEGMLSQLERQKGLTKAYVHAVTENSLQLHLECSRPELGAIVAANIHTTPDQALPTTYESSVPVPIRYWFKNQAFVDYEGDIPTLKEQQLRLKEHSIALMESGGAVRLQCSGRMTYSQLKKATNGLPEKAFALVTALEQLYEFSNQIQVAVADPDLEKKFPPDKRIHGRVILVRNESVIVRLGEVNEGVIFSEHFPPEGVPRLGEEVHADVISCDVFRQQVKLTMRRRFQAVMGIPPKRFNVNAPLFYRNEVTAAGPRNGVGPHPRRENLVAYRQIEHQTGTEIRILDEEGLIRIFGSNVKSLRQAGNALRRLVPFQGHAEMKIGSIGLFVGTRGANIKQLQAQTATNMRLDDGGRLAIVGRTGTGIRRAIRSVLRDNYQGELLHHQPPVRQQISAYRGKLLRPQLESPRFRPAKSRSLVNSAVSSAASSTLTTASKMASSPYAPAGARKMPTPVTPHSPSMPAVTRSNSVSRIDEWNHGLAKGAASVGMLIGFIAFFAPRPAVQCLMAIAAVILGLLAINKRRRDLNLNVAVAGVWAIFFGGSLLFCLSLGKTPPDVAQQALRSIWQWIRSALG